jgi:hypothetical protein
MQLAYDLWQAKRRAKKLHVKQFFAYDKAISSGVVVAQRGE